MATNAGGLQGGLYLIVLDDLHTDLARTLVVKAAARRFIERDLADTNLAAVVTTSGRLEAVQDFTSNRRLLLAAVDMFVGQKLRSAVLEKLDSYRREMDLTGQDLGRLGKPVNDAYDVQRGQRARNTLLTLKNLAESLSGVHGRRKALVYISEGISYATTNFEQWREISGNARRGVSIEGDLRDAITAAHERMSASTASIPVGSRAWGTRASRSITYLRIPIYVWIVRGCWRSSGSRRRASACWPTRPGASRQ